MKNLLFIFLLFVLPLISMSQPFGNSVYMDGTNDFITVPYDSNFNQTSTITIELWINPCDVSGNRALVNHYWCAGTQNAYTLGANDSILRWTWDVDGCGNGSGIFDSDQQIIIPNQWQHVAVVHTPDSVNLYYNGSLVSGTLSGVYGNIITSNEPVRIGAIRELSNAMSRHFNGIMDEVRIWDYALNAIEIQSRYNTTLSGNESGLIAYYNMDLAAVGAGINVPNISVNTSNIDGTTIGTNSSPIFQAANLCPGVGIYESNIKRILDVFPNPTNGLVTISADALLWKYTSIHLYNTLGQIVLEEEVNSINRNEHNIDLSSLSSGVYELVVIEGDRQYIAKVLVE